MKPVTVFSAFDGAGIGLLALKRAGVPIAAYYASEVDKYAMQVAKKNHPEIIHVGDVKQCYARNFPKIDLLIGGSPCQDLSIAKAKREGLKGARSGLFWHYVRLLRTMKPRYFLLENVASMSKEDKAKITEIIGVEPILINSALVSAQQRKRLYWTNIPDVTQPADKGILLKDVLETGISPRDKAYCLDANYWKTIGKNALENNRRQLVFQPVIYNPFNRIVKNDKANELGTRCDHLFSRTGQVVASPVKLGFVCGKDYQQNRVYSIKGKSVSLNGNGGGWGANTGLYKNLPDGDYTIRKLTPIECERLQTWPDNYTEIGQSCYCYNINDIINLAIKGKQLCKNVKLINAKVQSQTEKQDCVINIIYDISDTEQQNSQEIQLHEKENVLSLNAIINNKQDMDIVLNTIKDLREQEQQNLKKNIKNVNIAIDWQLQEKCVIGTIKIGCDTEMQNIQIKLEKEQINTDIKNLKENIKYSIEKLPQKYWGEIYHLKKLYTILIWINLIMIKKIYMCVIKTNTLAYINNLIEWQGNLLKLELSNLKMVDIFPISSTQRYKIIGNGWTADVIAHIFKFMKEAENDRKVKTVRMW